MLDIYRGPYLYNEMYNALKYLQILLYKSLCKRQSRLVYPGILGTRRIQHRQSRANNFKYSILQQRSQILDYKNAAVSKLLNGQCSNEEEKINDFDELLNLRRINEIEEKFQQKKKLIELDQLKEKLNSIVDKLNVKLKEIDSVGLSNEYTMYLDENYNQELRQKFQLIQREKGVQDSYTYYGQLNSEGQMHGLGTIMFKNGFSYQGMFSNGSREGIGCTFDLNNNKYKGEHKRGMREGQGIFKTSDGNIYEGGWVKNRMNGRGREINNKNECFIVYYKNGQKIEALASKINTKPSNEKQDKDVSRNKSENSIALDKLNRSYLSRTPRDKDSKFYSILRTDTSDISKSSKNKDENLMYNSQIKKSKTKKFKSKDDKDCFIF
eukprot:403375202